MQHPLVGVAKHSEKLEQLAATIIEERPSLVGFSCYMWNVNFFDLASRLRLALPETLLAFGGPEMARDYVEQGKYDDFAMNFCISGEGELTFLELLRALSQDTPDFAGILGLAYRLNDQESFSLNQARIPFKSLEQVPSPISSGVVDDEVLFRSKVEANLETQRGCTLRCSYCIYHKDMSRIAYNAVERTLQEVTYVINKGVKRIRFVDANFSSDLEHAKKVMHGLIKNRFETKLMFELIPGFIDEELASNT